MRNIKLSVLQVTVVMGFILQHTVSWYIILAPFLTNKTMNSKNKQSKLLLKTTMIYQEIEQNAIFIGQKPQKAVYILFML